MKRSFQKTRNANASEKKERKKTNTDQKVDQLIVNGETNGPKKRKDKSKEDEESARQEAEAKKERFTKPVSLLLVHDARSTFEHPNP